MLKLTAVAVNFPVVFEMFLFDARQNLRKVTDGQWGITEFMFKQENEIKVRCFVKTSLVIKPSISE